MTTVASTSFAVEPPSLLQPNCIPQAQDQPVEKPAPIKRKRFSARVPPSKVKKVLQADEEIGRLQAAVPAILGRAMEHFAENLLRETAKVTASSRGRTVMPSHMKTAICNDNQFSMLEDVVKSVVHQSTHASHASTSEQSPSKVKCKSGTKGNKRKFKDVVDSDSAT